MKKNILVTGSAGFIGFHLSKALKERGDAVLGYDNFNPYYSPKLKEERACILKQMGVEIIRGDLCNFELLKKTVEENSITHIVHLAAQAGVRYSLENPRTYLQTNVEGFFNLLEILRENQQIKLTFASSSSVYGLNKKLPFSENDLTDTQASLYGATKKTNELFAFTYHHLFGISATGLRFFTVYGPWGRPDMAYFSFTDAILKEKKIEIFNFGKMQRDFTYIDDIVEGTVAAIDLGAPFEIFNLGNHRPVELMKFIQIIEEAAGKKALFDYIPMQKGDVQETFADIGHSREKLHFFPRTSLEEGIPKFVSWYKKYLKAPRCI